MNSVTARVTRYEGRSITRRVSGRARCRDCGTPLLPVVNLVDYDGRGGYEGLASCNSVWACPVCSADIRAVRAREITEGVGGFLERGGGAYLVTLTVPHESADALSPLMDALLGAWDGMLKGSKYHGHQSKAGLVAELGIEGTIRSTEVLWGYANGWHPHIHALVLTRRPLCFWEECVLDEYVREHWSQYVRTLLGREMGEKGIDIRPVHGQHSKDAMLAYVGKLEDGGRWPLGNEMARGDIKKSRKLVGPFSLAAAAGAGDNCAHQLFQEYEAATVGRRSIVFSTGLRALLQAMPEEHPTSKVLVASIAARAFVAMSGKAHGGLLDLYDAAALVDGFDGAQQFICTWLGVQIPRESRDEPAPVPASPSLVSLRHSAAVLLGGSSLELSLSHPMSSRT